MSQKLDKADLESLVGELETLGIRNHEATIYLSLLRLGETGTGSIIKDTGLHGQYVYQSLERLEKNGLAQHVIQRGRRKYSAKPPRTLIHLAEEQKVRAELLTTRLNDFMVLPPDQTFEVYQGRDAYIAHEFDMLMCAREGSELLIIGGLGDQFNAEMGKRLGAYVSLQQKKGVHIRYIGSADQRVIITNTHGERKNFEIRYLPGLFTGQVNTNIWPDSLGFNIYGEPVTQFTVTSPIIAGSYKQFFEALWGLART